MVNIPSSSNDNVFPHVVLVVVFLDHGSRDGLHVVEVAKDGKTHLMVFENASMGDFNRSFERLGLLGFQ